MPKAQAAMEFLLTYGWAIIIVIGAIGVMAYLGLTDFAAMSPSSCESIGGLLCLDQPVFDLAKNQVAFSLRSSMPFSIVVFNLTGAGVPGLVCQELDWVGIKTGWEESPLFGGGVDIRPDTNFILTLNCSQPLKAGKARAEYLLHYRSKNTNIQHSAPITLRGLAS